MRLGGDWNAVHLLLNRPRVSCSRDLLNRNYVDHEGAAGRKTPVNSLRIQMSGV
jgi:hypothetical protein